MLTSGRMPELTVILIVSSLQSQEAAYRVTAPVPGPASWPPPPPPPPPPLKNGAAVVGTTRDGWTGGGGGGGPSPSGTRMVTVIVCLAVLSWSVAFGTFMLTTILPRVASVSAVVLIAIALEPESDPAVPGAGSARSASLPAASRMVPPLRDRASTPA